MEQKYDGSKDYKFFCFNGKVRFFKADFGRFVEHHANYYYLKRVLQEFCESGWKTDKTIGNLLTINLNISNAPKN